MAEWIRPDPEAGDGKRARPSRRAVLYAATRARLASASLEPALVSMQVTAADRAEAETAPALESLPDYPWGLRISLSERELAKLGLPADCAVGDQISFDCCARVCSVSLNDSESGASARVELQITEMAVDEDMSEEGDG